MRHFNIALSLGLVAVMAQPVLAQDLPTTDEDGERVFISATEGGSSTIVKDVPSLKAHIYASYTGRKYILGPNDVISVIVYDAPEFTQEKILVQPDGHITMAPFGSINMAGMTIQEAQQEMTDRLKYYLNDPKVTIKLEHTKPFNVYVSGAVLKPGSYELITDVNNNQVIPAGIPEVMLQRKLPLLSNVLVAAGGVSYDADLEHVRIENKIDGSTYEVNLLEMVQNADSSQDMFLVAGDTVHVPRLQSAYAVSDEKFDVIKGSTIFQRNIPVRVYGYVNQPGLVHLESAQSANLNSAIAGAGGYLNENNLSASYAPKEVLVSRVEQNGRLVTRRVDPRQEDMQLRPNDVVYVPEKARPRVGKAFDYAGRVITPIAGIASMINNWTLIFDPTRFATSVAR